MMTALLAGIVTDADLLYKKIKLPRAALGQFSEPAFTKQRHQWIR